MALTKVTYSMIEGTYVNALDFGVSTSSADNAAAFQAAIDYCLDNSKTLFLPSGDYTVLSTLYINGTRASGNQNAFRMVGELSSSPITHDDNVIVSKTNINFPVANSVLFEIRFNTYDFESTCFENFTVRQPRGPSVNSGNPPAAWYQTSVAFQYIKQTGNYVRKQEFTDVNCYGFGTFCEFSCPTGNPAVGDNYYGPIWMNRVMTRATRTGVDVNNVQLNEFFVNQCFFTQCNASGGIYGRTSSAMYLSLKDTLFEACEPAAVQTGSYQTRVSFDNVSSEACGSTSGYGLLKHYIPVSGYASNLQVYFSNMLYAFAFMPEEIRLYKGARISSQCPIKAAGSGFFIDTPDTVTPVVANNPAYNQTDLYTMFFTPLSINNSRPGKKLLSRSIAGSNSNSGKTAYSNDLPPGFREYAIGLSGSQLINNSQDATTCDAGYVYGSFAYADGAADQGFSQSNVTIYGSNLGPATGFAWPGPFSGVVTYMAPVGAGQDLTTVLLSLYDSDWRTPIYWSNPSTPMVASVAAAVYPRTKRDYETINNSATVYLYEIGEASQNYAVRVRLTFNGGSLGVFEYTVRGNGTNAGRTYVTGINSLAAGIAVSNTTNLNADLYYISVANTTGGAIEVQKEVEYLT